MEALTRYYDRISAFYPMEVGKLLSEHKLRVCKEQILINEEKKKRCYLDTLFIVQGSKAVKEESKEKKIK